MPSPYGEPEARAFLSRRHDSLHAGTEAPFAIVASKDVDHGLLGSISLLHLAWEEGRAEVGYWLAPEARGQGHGTRAVRSICEWGVNTLGLARLELLTATANLASQRVAERAGFTREAVLRSYLLGKQGRLDMVVFGLLAEELGLAGVL